MCLVCNWCKTNKKGWNSVAGILKGCLQNKEDRIWSLQNKKIDIRFKHTFYHVLTEHFSPFIFITTVCVHCLNAMMDRVCSKASCLHFTCQRPQDRVKHKSDHTLYVPYHHSTNRFSNSALHTQPWTKRDTHTTFVKYSEDYSRYAQKDDSRDDGRECK